MALRWLVGLGLVCALAPAARAEEKDAAKQPSTSTSKQTSTSAAPKASSSSAKQAATSPAFGQACVDLIHGRLPPGGPDAAEALQKACASLMESHASALRENKERAKIEKELGAAGAPEGSKAAATGTGAGPSEGQAAGQGAAASQGLGAQFSQAGHELTATGGTGLMGRKRSGAPVRFSLVTNPVGYFTGLGINAEGFGSLIPKLSWVGGLRYSKTDATNGSVDTFGLEGGADWFLYGRNNEGLRIGPRLELALGREDFQTATNFAWLGMSGEVGYNFVASNGITGTLSAGVGGRIAGDKREDFSSFTGGEFGAYGKIGIGYSW